MRHRRSNNLLAATRKTAVAWPEGSGRSKRYWHSMSDNEFRRVGQQGQHVKSGNTVHQQDLHEARTEQRHPQRQWNERHT